VIADEPTSALDMVMQAQVLRLMRELRDQFGGSLLFISHDLAVVSAVCDRLGDSARRGQLWKRARRRRYFAAPCHPYTQSLMAAIPGYCREGYNRTDAHALR